MPGLRAAQQLVLEQRCEHFIAQRRRACGRQSDAADDHAGAAAIERCSARLCERTMASGGEQMKRRIEGGRNIVRQLERRVVRCEALDETAARGEHRVCCAGHPAKNLSWVELPAPARHCATCILARFNAVPELRQRRSPGEHAAHANNGDNVGLRSGTRACARAA